VACFAAVSCCDILPFASTLIAISIFMILTPSVCVFLFCNINERGKDDHNSVAAICLLSVIAMPLTYGIATAVGSTDKS
jgi:hypothetical protein